MGKTYRFSWNHDNSDFEVAKNLNELTNNRQRVLLEIVNEVRTRSGLVRWASWKGFAVLLLVFTVMAMVGYFLTGIQSVWGQVFIISAPFISFCAVGYLMLRKTGIDSINNYFLRHQLRLELKATEARCLMTQQFSRSIISLNKASLTTMVTQESTAD